MREKRMLLIGGGGHCLSVYDALSGYDRVGVIERHGAAANCKGLPVVGTDEDLPRLFREGWTEAFLTVGSTGDTSLRRRLYTTVRKLGFQLPVIVDASAVVAGDVNLGEGCFVGKGAILNARCSIGACAIINTGAIVEHECSIGAFAHICPGATICGGVTVGEDTHIGAGSVIRQGLNIGGGTLVGIGSIVVKNLPGHVKAYGNPCRVVE